MDILESPAVPSSEQSSGADRTVFAQYLIPDLVASDLAGQALVIASRASSVLPAGTRTARRERYSTVKRWRESPDPVAALKRMKQSACPQRRA